MRTLTLSRFRYQWLLVVLMLLGVGTSSAFGAESPGATSVQAIYDKKCARCHGATGKGNGAQARMVFWMKMPDMSDAATMQTRSDEVLFRAIKQGGKAGMPGFGLELSESDITGLVAYVRGFSKTSGSPKPAGATR